MKNLIFSAQKKTFGSYPKKCTQYTTYMHIIVQIVYVYRTFRHMLHIYLLGISYILCTLKFSTWTHIYSYMRHF